MKQSDNSTGMTKTERQELGALIRKRERVMKHQAKERSLALLAEFDVSMAKIYHFDNDPIWKQAQAEAEKAVEEAKIAIAGRCQALGIPVEFAPNLHLFWTGRGQNAAADRRAELRRAAKSRIEAMEQEAITRIERMSLEAQTEVVAQGLESDAAKTFLQAMPAVDKLMPLVPVVEIQQLVEAKRAERSRLGYVQ